LPSNPESREDQLRFARNVLSIESAAIAQVAERLGEELLQAVDKLHDSEGCVLVTGVGKAGLVGQKVAATFASTGTPAHFLHPTEAMHGDLGRITQRDVVLALSNSGETSELSQILEPIKRSCDGLVAVTSRPRSTLARMADIAIVYGAVREACPIGVAPSTSCTVMMAIGDAMAFLLMRKRQFGSAEFGRFHPAGSLGRRLKAVNEVMRGGPQLRIADASLSVAEVFAQSRRIGRGTGAIMLVDADGKLEGLFTDSDLARLVERREFAAFDRPIAECMTRHPITLQSGQRVEDALTLLHGHQISEIPVLDQDGRPIGLVDITDLVELLPAAA
jgi:arabinose-5-phosphate isomerase